MLPSPAGVQGAALPSLTARVAGARSIGEIHTELADAARDCRFDHFLCAFRFEPLPPREPLQGILTNYPTGWIEEYDRHGFIAADPVFRRLCQTAAPFAWREAPTQSPLERNVARRAAAWGIHDGYAIPVHGIAGEITVLALSPLRLGPADPALHALSAFAQHLHAAARRVLIGPEPPPPCLTPALLEVLDCVAGGFSRAEAAGALGLSVRGVDERLRRAQQCLGVADVAEAVRVAARHAWITGRTYPTQMRYSDIFIGTPAAAPPPAAASAPHPGNAAPLAY